MSLELRKMHLKDVQNCQNCEYIYFILKEFCENFYFIFIVNLNYSTREKYSLMLNIKKFWMKQIVKIFVIFPKYHQHCGYFHENYYFHLFLKSYFSMCMRNSRSKTDYMSTEDVDVLIKLQGENYAYWGLLSISGQIYRVMEGWMTNKTRRDI